MVFGRLLPREGNFFELFNDHGQRIAEGAQAFLAMVQNYDDAAEREHHSVAVGEAERAADKVTAKVHRLLHRTFITPLDREQIHRLINAMDDVLDLLQDTSEVMSRYMPGSMPSRPARRVTIRATSLIVPATVASWVMPSLLLAPVSWTSAAFRIKGWVSDTLRL